MVQQLQQHARTGLSSATGAISNCDLRFMKKPERHTIVNGIRQTLSRSIQRESEDGVTVYTACEWQDEATGNVRYSCNCPGWSILKKDARDRWCKHAIELAANLALNDGKQPVGSSPATAPPTSATAWPGEQIVERRHRHVG